MKYLKTFESLDEPENGDYVSCQEHPSFNITTFTFNNVGRIVRRDIRNDDSVEYVVEYDNISEDLLGYFGYMNHDFGSGYYRKMARKEIKFWSKNKENVIEYIVMRKYNL